MFICSFKKRQQQRNYMQQTKDLSQYLIQNPVLRSHREITEGSMYVFVALKMERENLIGRFGDVLRKSRELRCYFFSYLLGKVALRPVEFQNETCPNR